MKFPHLLLTVILSAAVAFAVARYAAPEGAASAPTEKAYARVLRTNTLRCGYQYWDGGVMKDEKTGAIYGPWVDILNAIGDATGLKVEWAEQVGWPDVGAALKSGKIDAMCAGMWTDAAKAREIGFSVPLAYQAIEAFARADDHRFDGDLDKLNDPSVTLAVIENDNSDHIAQEDFPKAKKDSLNALNGTDGDLLLQVMTGKADATFTIAGTWRDFDKANPGKVRRIDPDKKLRTFGNAIGVDNDEPRLLGLINAGAQEIENSGKLDKLLDQANQKWPDMYIKPLKPFP